LGYHQAMRGFFDTHIHSAPDISERCGDDIDIAREAKAASLAGIVLKNHIFPTGARAHLTMKAVEGIRVVGGIVLNSPFGFVNAEAVECSFTMGGRVLWMATRDARLYEAAWEAGEISAEELRSTLRIVARHRGVLGTGHLRGAALEALIKTALDLGVERIVVNHPDSASVGLSLTQQIELAQLKGVWLERAYLHLHPAVKQPIEKETIFRAIRATGVENNLIATDLGRAGAPSPAEGMAAWCRILNEAGFGKEEIARLGRDNPRAIYFT